jgi:phage FluMu protein Com
MKALKVPCSACGAVLAAPDTAVGRKGKCPKCGALVTIVDDASAEPSLPESEAPTPLPESVRPVPRPTEELPDDAMNAIPVHAPAESESPGREGLFEQAPGGTTGTATSGDLETLSEADLVDDGASSDFGLEGEDDRPMIRDRIVVLGRRASGKTVYLSVLYDKLWNSLDGLSMKAVSGTVHSDLVRIAAGLREGRWPPATLESQHLDIELSYKRRKQMLVALDYAGELFRKTFVEDVTDTPEAESLLEHIDRAAAVIMLMDPDNAVHGDIDARTDDDYGLSQAVARIRNWPGGSEVPVVLVFTKSDMSFKLVKEHGGLASFIKKFYPALARSLKKVQIFQVSAVQVARDASGKVVPKRDSKPINLEQPLVHCLDYLAEQVRLKEESEDLLRRVHDADRRREEAARRVQLMAEQEAQAQRRTQIRLIAIIAGMVVAAAILTIVLVSSC